MRISSSLARQLDRGKPGTKPAAPRRRRVMPPEEWRPAPDQAVTLEVRERPVPKERARIVNAGGHTFTPDRTALYAKRVASAARIEMHRHGPFLGPVDADVLVELVPPRSWKKADRQAALLGEIMPTARPDLDNLVKNAFDALNGIVFRDDSQVVRKSVEKRYGTADRLLMTLKSVSARGSNRRGLPPGG